jgi:hypothetical protein
MIKFMNLCDRSQPMKMLQKMKKSEVMSRQKMKMRVTFAKVRRLKRRK